MIGALFVLSWSIGVFVEAGKFIFEEKRISIVNQPVSNVAVVEAKAFADAPVLIEEVESESQAVSSLPPSAEIVKPIADKYGVDWRLVYSVCKVESNCNSDRIGDGGNSYGAYQIYLPAHPDITVEQAKNFEWATEWTIKHGLRYKENPQLFCKNHNGIAKVTNDWYVDKCFTEYQKLKLI